MTEHSVVRIVYGAEAARDSLLRRTPLEEYEAPPELQAATSRSDPRPERRPGRCAVAETWQVPGYVALARQAASAIGAPHDAIVRAILAQWQCEQPSPAPWPPVHNNPGNLTRLIGALGGPPPPVATSWPGKGLLYAYQSPQAGAAAYATYLLRSSRYGTALAHARAGDGAGFLQLVCEAGYGTRASCCASLFARSTLPAPAPPAPPPAAVPPRWRCVAGPVNIRTAAGTTAGIIGAVRVGQIIAGTHVSGGAYHAGRATRSDWIELRRGAYCAAAFFVRI